MTYLTARRVSVCYRPLGVPMDKYKLDHSVLPSLTSRVIEVLAALVIVLVVILLL